MGKLFIGLNIILLSLSFSLSSAQGAMAVIDTTAAAKWSEQIKAMEEQAAQLQEQIDKATEQLEVINEMSETAQNTVDAIGEATTISLPFANLAKLASQVKRDMMCLMPDLDGMFPKLDLKDLSWDGVCDSANVYKDTFFETGDDNNQSETGDLTYQEMNKNQSELRNRRQQMLEDSTLKGLAGGDIGVKASTELLDAGDELKASADQADTMNKRLAVIAQGQILIVSALAQQNQTLSQMLKLQAAYALEAGLPLTSSNAALTQPEEQGEGE